MEATERGGRAERDPERRGDDPLWFLAGFLVVYGVLIYQVFVGFPIGIAGLALAGRLLRRRVGGAIMFVAGGGVMTAILYGTSMLSGGLCPASNRVSADGECGPPTYLVLFLVGLGAAVLAVVVRLWQKRRRAGIA